MKFSEALRIRIKELCGEYHMNPSGLSQKACGNSTISSFMSKDQETLYMPTIYSICLALNLSKSSSILNASTILMKSTRSAISIKSRNKGKRGS